MKCTSCNGSGGSDPSLVKPPERCSDCDGTGQADSATCHFIGGPYGGQLFFIGSKPRELTMFEQPTMYPARVIGQLGGMETLKPRRHLYTRGRTGDYYWTGPA